MEAKTKSVLASDSKNLQTAAHFVKIYIHIEHMTNVLVKNFTSTKLLGPR